MNNEQQQQNILQGIIQQLGGNKFAAMTGATFMSDGNTLITKFKGSRVANIMYITLDPSDTYTVRFCKYRGLNVKEIKNMSGIYSGMLCPIFEKTTGLKTSL